VTHHSLTLNGLQHRLYTWGDPAAPKLFLIHGWLDSGAAFEFLCRELAPHYYCLAPDLRGMGHSQHSPSALGYFFYEYVADLYELFQQLAAGETLRVLGHSMGGNILSLYAGTFPEQISHFINVEGFGIRNMPPQEGPGRLRQWVAGRSQQPFSHYPSIEDFAQRLQKTHPRLPHDRALFLAERRTHKTAQGYQLAADPRHKWVHPYLFQEANLIPFWQAIEAQCLLVLTEHGLASEAENAAGITASTVEQRLRYFARAKRIVIPNCGHMIHYEEPKALADAILPFLATGID